MIIGITGGSGCGKTTVLKIIQEMGGLVLDCDEIYHELLKTDWELLCAIGARFPGVVAEGSLDRKKLGSQVFSDPEALLDLNRIAHGAVKREVLRWLQKAPALVAIDAIALFEGGLAELCDRTVAITAPIEARITRLMARDHITKEYALSRLNAQKSNEEFSAMTDFTLENSGTREAFQHKAAKLLRDLTHESSATRTP